jgi:hypothetical protein
LLALCLPAAADSPLCGNYPYPDCRADPAGPATATSPSDHHLKWAEIWGVIGLPVYFTGERVAPNGATFKPLFAIDTDFNLGLLPNKKLYLFSETKFWMQRAAPGITNAAQGSFDFSKREFDFVGGLAWSYYDPFELRVSGYSLANLNRGTSVTRSAGFVDGILVENRFYFPTTDKYDLGRLSFIGLGFFPQGGMRGDTTGVNDVFRTGFYARAYGAYDLPALPAYLFLDARFTTEWVASPRVVELDGGIAARPFGQFQNFEWRLGASAFFDLNVGSTRSLFYSSARFVY